MNKYFLLNTAKGLVDKVNNMYGVLGYLKCIVGYPQEFRANVQEIKKYKGIHRGQRCFIIGNGPSLKEQDISALKNEITFTVNQAGRNEQIRSICPTYHCWVDPVFFKLDSKKSEDKEVIKAFTTLYSENNRPITFLPQQAYSFVQEAGLSNKIDIQYFISTLQKRKEYIKSFDLSKSIPAFGTVVQTCIAIAMYMGFSEIYLLGCDTTGIITMINSALDGDGLQYGYSISENEKNRLHNQYRDNKFLIESIVSFADLLETYEKLYKYAIRHDVKLINCSKETIITTIPRMKLEEIL